jgi:hypothetical protein
MGKSFMRLHLKQSLGLSSQLHGEEKIGGSFQAIPGINTTRYVSEVAQVIECLTSKQEVNFHSTPKKKKKVNRVGVFLSVGQSHTISYCNFVVRLDVRKLRFSMFLIPFQACFLSIWDLLHFQMNSLINY